MTCGFLIQLVFWFIGVEVEQQTSAPPPKKILDPPLQRYITQQQIQGFTQEEGSPLCSSENEEEYLSSLMMKAFKQTMSLPRFGSSSEDDDEEGDHIQITVTTTKSGRSATRYLLEIVRWVLLKLYENCFCGWGRVILFHVQTRKGATLCYAMAKTGPREIMYRKIKMHQTSPPPPL